MKNYYFVLIENFIGIVYLILFLLGFFTGNLNLYHIGGIGMLIFIFIMIKGQPKNLFSFLFMCGIGFAVAYFVSKWWLGIFWVTAFYTVGQLFGIRALLKNKEQIENMNLENYTVSGMKSESDKIGLIEILFFIGLLIGPYLFADNPIENKVDTKSNSLEKEINEQVMYLEKSQEYSNLGIQLMNLSDSQVVSQNKIDSYKELLKKSIEEAKKVDTTIVNKMKSGYGTIYFEKYLRSKQLELQGYETGNASSLMKAQILYDEYLDWLSENMINPK